LRADSLFYIAGKYIRENQVLDKLLLEHSELRYRRLFEAAQDGILILNAETGKIDDVNPYLINMLGYSREEFIEKKLWEVGAFKDVEASKEAFAALQTEKYIRYENLPLRAKNGKLIHVEFISNVYLVGDKKVIQCNIRDITVRKQIEEEVLEQLERLVQERTTQLMYANRIKDEFLTNMSHELRTPLNGILGLSESLLDEVYGGLVQRQSKAIKMIQSNGEHLLELINDILDISKIEAGKLDFSLEPVNVNHICHSSLAFVKQLANKKSITIEYSPPQAAHMIMVDSRRFKQILINLLNNAVKFTPEKGKITLEVQANAQESEMRFSVTDTGIGITAEDIKKLFIPFTQLDTRLSRINEGSGLGLALVKKMVEMHGGSVEVQSKPGTGSRFSFVLPWDEKIQNENSPDLVEVKAEKEDKVSVSMVRGKILIAEDHEVNFTVVKDYLENYGYQIFIARDGSEVLSKAGQILPDIILMDIQMPNLNGLEATRLLRADPRFATVPIIALTAFAMSGDRERCLEAGMNEYLSKPVKLKILEQTIQRFLNSVDNTSM
jgi:PAS domain S-box-containing protein